MSGLVGGFGTGHSPICSEPPQHWAEHGAFEMTIPETVALLAEIGSDTRRTVSADTYAAAYGRVQHAIEAVQERIAAAQLDALIIVGDDQDDLFPKDEIVPTLAVYCGESYVNPAARLEGKPEWYASTLWGHAPLDGEEIYPCDADLATKLVSSFSEDGLGPAIVHRAPTGRHVGHAFNFVNRRLLQDPRVPTVPVMLNTYYPPNQPTVDYCLRLGESIARTVDEIQGKRVGLVASGGLTHPVVDEELDLGFLKAVVEQDYDFMRQMPEELLQEGSTEFKNWITVARAMDVAGLKFELQDYVPVYRTEVGTGIGLTFGTWG